MKTNRFAVNGGSFCFHFDRLPGLLDAPLFNGNVISAWVIVAKTDEHDALHPQSFDYILLEFDFKSSRERVYAVN